MSLIDKIKEFFGKILHGEDSKLLEEGSLEYNNDNRKNRNKRWLLNNSYGYRHIQTKLDYDIQKFLSAYCDILDNYPKAYKSNCEDLGYYALVRMNSKPVTEKEFKQNKYTENLILERLAKDPNYVVNIQGSKKYPSFYHIMSRDISESDESNMRSLYLNCNNGNIAELAYTILQCNTSPDFYLKFCSNFNNSKHSRGDKIVIYFDKSDLSYIAQLLSYIKSQRPYLFEESDLTLPFLQNLNGFASISKRSVLDEYTNLHGDKSSSRQSTNSVLSMILRESYNETVKEIAKSESELSFLVEPTYSEVVGVKNFPYIQSKYKYYLLNSMKEKMKILSQKNDIYIEGLFPQNTSKSKSKSHSQKFNRDDNQEYK